MTGRLLSFQISISTVICIFIADQLNWEPPFFAALACIITSKIRTSTSFKLGAERIAGTLIGATTGVGLLYTVGDTLLAYGVGLIFITLVCLKLFKKTINVAPIVFVAILMTRSNEAFYYTLLRVRETFLGIIVTVAVSTITSYLQKRGD